LIVEAPKSVLAFGNVRPTTFTGGLGGPFNPSVLTVELRNTGNIPLQWSSSADVSWLLIHPEIGALAPGQSESVEISLGSAAEDFPSGILNGITRFENETDVAQALEQTFQVDVRSKVEQTSAVIENGVFRGELNVPAGNSHQVEYSEDLLIWIPLHSDVAPTLSGGTLKFEDPVSAAGLRFYRVRVE
jgi:hypothetical protein